MKLSRQGANLTLFIVTAMWGSSYIFNKMVVQAGMQPATINAVRGVMCLLTGLLIFHRQLRHMTSYDLRVGLMVGVVNFCGFFLRTAGLQTTTPGKSAFLTVTYVVFTPLVMWLFWHERPQRQIWIAVPLSLLGMAILTGVTSTSFTLLTGDWLTLLSAVCWSFQIIIFAKYASHASSPWVIITLIGFVQVILGTPLALLFEGPSFGHIDWWAALWPLAIVAIVITFIARSLQLVAQKFTDPTTASLILMTESFFATVFSVLFGFEKLTSTLAIGGALILLANVILQLKQK
ncbi:DMT superfamily drug metabolite transporter [Limosilactobacillus frumenti DSM 13145]|uniref:DMT superfamily drug metabolite transporter n=1 Tax=Limosilactobacillus frumenti DSM 13145 TaxID=1423746 RepID=A0A0R1P681_9LACO|nr:DMT family transporter [Limosilactobacillus frumenti]KRL27990.1 DMT superfamily drug metabolite transporter [Limosilactobacillus frumenti DSM 13145]MBA2913516.1 DMT family transporter [Limosilactobacillus frumenti]QFG73175.1 DMT family transporter [Limosilactobacillus frumenti]